MAEEKGIVVIIEDDPDVSEVYAKFLQSKGIGYKIFEHEDDAFPFITGSKDKISLVICDGKDGGDLNATKKVLQRIGEIAGSLPIVVISGTADNWKIDDFSDIEQVVAYRGKPVFFKDFISVVSKHSRELT